MNAARSVSGGPQGSPGSPGEVSTVKPCHSSHKIVFFGKFRYIS